MTVCANLCYFTSFRNIQAAAVLLKNNFSVFFYLLKSTPNVFQGFYKAFTADSLLNHCPFACMVYCDIIVKKLGTIISICIDTHVYSLTLYS